MKKSNKVRYIAILILMVGGFTLLFTSSRFFGKSSYAEVEGVVLTENSYTDGTYTGTADGFRPDLIVEVAISENRLTTITVVDHNEVGRNYWGTPVLRIPEQILETQSTIVDTVSGATATSKGILAAVEDALAQAKVQ